MDNSNTSRLPKKTSCIDRGDPVADPNVTQTRENFPFITFSKKKRMNRDTLRRIRSHAMHAVQYRKYVQQKFTPNSASNESPIPLVSGRNQASMGPALKEECVQHEKNASWEVSDVDRDQTRNLHRRAGRSERQIRTGYRSMGLATSSFCTPHVLADPFNAFPAQIDHRILRLFTFCFDRWKCDVPKTQFIRETLSNPVLFHSYAAVWLHLLNDDASIMSHHESVALRHMSERLKMVHDRRRQGEIGFVDDLVLSMSRMALIQVTRGQIAESLQHLRGIDILISANGHMADDQARTSLGSLLLSYYASWHQVPIYLRYPFGCLTHSARQEVESVGFRVPTNSLLLSSAARRIIPLPILDISLALAALCSAVDFRSGAATKQEPHFLARESVKMALRLVYMGDTSVGTSSKSSSLSESLRLTLLIFIWGFSRKVSRGFNAMSTSHACVQPFLQEYYSRPLSPERNDFLKAFLLWQLMVLGATALSDQEMDTYAGFAVQNLHVNLKSSFQEVEAECCRFIWLKFPSPSPAEDFWDHIRRQPVNAVR